MMHIDDFTEMKKRVIFFKCVNLYIAWSPFAFYV
jgi:hypothetical protein